MYFYKKKKSMRKIVLSVFLMLIASLGVASQAVLFVSLRMPDNALKAYFKQGKQYHIPLVIRGLYTEKQNEIANQFVGSFRDTANRVKQLIKESKAGGVSIDPLLFRAFNIHVVPALVVYDDDLTCIKQTNHVIYISCPVSRLDIISGNLPIKKLLSIVANQSKSSMRSEFSKSLLVKYRKEEEGA